MHAQPPVPGAEIGVIGAAGAARVREDEDALLVVHEGLRLGEIGGAGAVLDAADGLPLRTMRRERPVTSATRSVPKRCTIWSSAPCTGGSAASCSIMRSRRSTASRHCTGWPSRKTGRDDRLPSSSVKGSKSWVGKECAR